MGKMEPEHTMNNIFLVPIEPLENRYTKHWYDFLPKQIHEKTGRAIINISGIELETKTTPGAFLNFSSTVNYKSTQMMEIAKHFNNDAVKNGDTFLFTDFWNPAAHFVRYMADLANIRVKMVGICHAGAYDPYDLLGQKFRNKDWSKRLEQSFDELFDVLIFATKFSQDLYLQGVDVKYDEIKHRVTGFPMEYYKDILPFYWDLENKPPKENIVVFPHRKSPEKQPELFEKLSKHFPDWQFVFAQDVCKNKDEYHNLLYRSKIMFSANLQETLGIGTFEALFAGCDIIVPNRLSYVEMYPDYIRSFSDDETYLAHLLRNRMKSYKEDDPLRKMLANDIMKKYLTGDDFYKAL